MENQDVIKALLPSFTKKAGKMGYEVGESPYNDSPLVTLHKGGEYVFSLVPDGAIHYKKDTPYRGEVMDLANTLAEMKEAYGIFLNAAPLPIEDVSDFRPLSKYGKYLLAARMEPDSSLHFVTWEYSYDRKGVMWGHYYGDNYAGAKEDFAIRAGLIDKDKLFSEEELAVLYDACSFRKENDGGKIAFEDENKLQGVIEKIEGGRPGKFLEVKRCSS